MLGEAGSSVVLFGMKREVMENPESFARMLSGILESGAAPVFNALTEGALAYTKRRPKEQSAKDLLEKTLERSPEEDLGAETVKQALLHDFRMRDEMQEYMERKAKEESEDR